MSETRRGHRRRGIEKMIELARPGVDEGILYSRVMQRMVSLGSEYYPMAFYSGLHGGAGCRGLKIRQRDVFFSPCVASPTKWTRSSVLNCAGAAADLVGADSRRMEARH